MKLHNALFSTRKKVTGFLALCAALSIFTFAQSAQAQVQLDGKVWFSMVGSRLTVYIEELENLGDTATDRLRLVVWATEDHWSNADRGHLLGYVALPRMAAQRDKDNLSRSMKLHRPDTDRYYVTVTVEERVVDENGTHWELRDWRESDDRVVITSTKFPFFPWD